MEAIADGASPPKIRVLVADDEELIAQTLATILNLAGYEVCAVYGGEAAIRLLDLFKPDLVITDVSMPDITGMEVASVAHAHLPRCKILLFSGHAGLHALLQPASERDLPYELITKPMRPEDLLAKLRDTLSGDRPALIVPIDLDDENVH